MSGINDFDFLLGSWTIHNRRRTNAFSPTKDGVWEEFEAIHTGAKHLDGKVNIEHFEGAFPSGEIRKGLTIRTFDPQSQQWSICWLDNANPADFSPLVGRFQDGIGLFYEEVEGLMVEWCASVLLGITSLSIQRVGSRRFLLTAEISGTRIG